MSDVKVFRLEVLIDDKWRTREIGQEKVMKEAASYLNRRFPGKYRAVPDE